MERLVHRSRDRACRIHSPETLAQVLQEAGPLLGMRNNHLTRRFK
jgi:hypothetical protein